MQNNRRSEGIKLKAVLFDMDGTLIDSEKLWTIALQDVAHDLGGELSAETRTAMIGTDLVGSVRMLHLDIGYDGDIEVTKRHVGCGHGPAVRRATGVATGSQGIAG